MRYIGLIIALFALACVAHAQVFLDENFDSGIPAGWTVTDGGETTDTWHGINDYGGSTLDGSAFAIVDSDDAGSVDMDEILESPSVNLTGYANYYLEFDHYFNSYGSEIAGVDVWDGSAWQNVASFSGSDIGGWGAPDHQNIDITAYANANLKVRFHYYDANYDLYWAVDDVKISGQGILDPCNISSLDFSGSSHTPTFESGYYYFDVCKDDVLTLQANANCTNCGSGTDYSWVINAYDGNGPVSYSDDVLDYDIDYASGYDAVLEIEGDNCYASYPLRFRASDGPEIGNISTTINGCTGAGTEITVGASGSSVEVEGYHGEVSATLGVGAETFIPDGPSCATQCYESSVTFTDFAPGASIENPGDIQYVKINMEHTFIGDMQITLEGPGGCGSATILQYNDNGNNYNWPYSIVLFYCVDDYFVPWWGWMTDYQFAGYGILENNEWTVGAKEDATIFPTEADAENAVLDDSNTINVVCSAPYTDGLVYNVDVANVAFGNPNVDDFSNNTDPCDETEWYNDSGEGWDYCWSDNASYAYAPTANSYVYEAGNVDYYDAAEAPYAFMRVNPSDETNGTNFYHPYENFYSELEGCPLNGTWTVKVCDSWELDNGWIFAWELALDPGLLPVNWDYDVDVAAVDWSAITDADFTGAYPAYDLIPEPDLGTGSYGGTFSVIDEFGCTSDAALTFDVTGMPAISGLTAGDFVWAGFEGEEWNAGTNNWFEYDGTDFHYASNFPEEDKNVYIVDYCGNADPEIDNAEAYCHDLNIDAGKSLSMSSTSEQTLNISGDWNNEGTFDAGISTVNFNGDSDQNLSTVAPGGESFYNLALNQDAGSQVIVNQDLTIINELNITSGIINTNSNTLYIDNPSPAALVGANLSGNDGFIKGRLQRATDGSSTYNFPIGYDGYGAQGFDITPSGSAGAQVLAYMEPFAFAPVYIQAYCDVEVHPGGGSHIIGEGDPGYDGIPDKILFDLQSPLQWDVSNPGGGITSYDINVYPSGSQMISPVVSANGVSMLYLMKNGEPGNAGVPAGDQQPWFDQDGFLRCPTQTSLSGLTAFSKFNLLGASGTGSALPVELLSFDASYDEEVVTLTWATASERNNDFFEVQKSENAYDFAAIGQLGSLAPGGNSNTRLNYTLTDGDVNQGTYYYRLKQVEFDGTYAFSEIVSVNIDGSNPFAIYPNPVDDYIHIHFYCESPENPQVEIYDQEARLVHAEKLMGMKGYNHATIDLSTLSDAVYTLTLITVDGVQQAKLVKQ